MCQMSCFIIERVKADFCDLGASFILPQFPELFPEIRQTGYECSWPSFPSSSSLLQYLLFYRSISVE